MPPGVGSKASQPTPSIHTSGQAWSWEPPMVTQSPFEAAVEVEA